MFGSGSRRSYSLRSDSSKTNKDTNPHTTNANTTTSSSSSSSRSLNKPPSSQSLGSKSSIGRRSHSKTAGSSIVATDDDENWMKVILKSRSSLPVTGGQSTDLVTSTIGKPVQNGRSSTVVLSTKSTIAGNDEPHPPHTTSSSSASSSSFSSSSSSSASSSSASSSASSSLHAATTKTIIANTTNGQLTEKEEDKTSRQSIVSSDLHWTRSNGQPDPAPLNHEWPSSEVSEAVLTQRALTKSSIEDDDNSKSNNYCGATNLCATDNTVAPHSPADGHSVDIDDHQYDHSVEPSDDHLAGHLNDHQYGHSNDCSNDHIIKTHPPDHAVAVDHVAIDHVAADHVVADHVVADHSLERSSNGIDNRLSHLHMISHRVNTSDNNHVTIIDAGPTIVRTFAPLDERNDDDDDEEEEEAVDADAAAAADDDEPDHPYFVRIAAEAVGPIPILSNRGTIRGVKNRVRSGIASILEKHNNDTKTTVKYAELEKGLIVFYTTSVSAVRETFEKCLKVKRILQTQMVDFEERNVFVSKDLHQQLIERLQQQQHQQQQHQQQQQQQLESSLELPQVFVDGYHLGNAEEIERLNESGVLRKIFSNFKKVQHPKCCTYCGGYRFIPCNSCHGSKKSRRNHFTTHEFCVLRCTSCDENGLVKCEHCNVIIIIASDNDDQPQNPPDGGVMHGGASTSI